MTGRRQAARFRARARGSSAATHSPAQAMGPVSRRLPLVGGLLALAAAGAAQAEDAARHAPDGAKFLPWRRLDETNGVSLRWAVGDERITFEVCALRGIPVPHRAARHGACARSAWREAWQHSQKRKKTPARRASHAPNELPRAGGGGGGGAMPSNGV